MPTRVLWIAIVACLSLLAVSSGASANCCAGVGQPHPNCVGCVRSGGQPIDVCAYLAGHGACGCGWQTYFENNQGLGCYPVGICIYSYSYQDGCYLESEANSGRPGCSPWEPVRPATRFQPRGARALNGAPKATVIGPVARS